MPTGLEEDEANNRKVGTKAGADLQARAIPGALYREVSLAVLGVLALGYLAALGMAGRDKAGLMIMAQVVSVQTHGNNTHRRGDGNRGRDLYTSEGGSRRLDNPWRRQYCCLWILAW